MATSGYLDSIKIIGGDSNAGTRKTRYLRFSWSTAGTEIGKTTIAWELRGYGGNNAVSDYGVQLNGEWIIPKKFARTTYKQVKCVNFICNELGLRFEPILKSKTWKFINTYFDAAKLHNKQRRDNNFRDWCEDNLEWLPEYF